MAFKPKETKIEDIFSIKKKYVIPRYQRKYIWDEEQWTEMYEDIFIYTKDEGHFFGSFVLEEHKNTIEMNVIDGQQRITTIIIVFSVFIKLFQLLDNKLLLEDTEVFVKGLDEGIKYPKLCNDEINAISYIVNITDSISGEIVDLKKQLIKCGMKKNNYNYNVCNAFEYFYKRISNELYTLNKDEKIDKLKSLRKIFVKTKVLEIVVGDERDGYNIFEILNARGVELEQHELLKNFILNYSRPTTTLDIARNEWETLCDNLTIKNKEYINSFLGHYTTHKYEKPKRGNKEFRIIKSNVKKDKVKNLLDDLLAKSLFYRYIIDPDYYKNSDDYIEIIYDSLLYFKNMNIRQVRPLLLSVFSIYEEKKSMKQLLSD